MSQRPRVIDSDGHVIEPASLWQDYVEPAWRDRAPQVVTSARGETLLGLGELAMDIVGSARPAGMQAPPQSDGWEEQSRHKMALRGGWDPRARLVDMDADGIDQAVLYPTQMLAVTPDPALFAALCRAYNDWLRDYCSAAPGRLFGVGVMPLGDVALAIRELQRCVRELGFKAVMIRPAPYIGTRKLYHPVYDPFWQEAQDLGCPVAVHPLPFGDLPNSCRGLRLDEGMDFASQGLFLRQGLTNALDVMLAMAWFVGGGICERFPRLKVALLEGSGGWVCTMLERLEHHFHVFGSEHQKMSPRELFARQCWISFDPDEVALPFTAEKLGSDRILWASDYPHPDAKIPGVVAELREALAPLAPADQARILGGTAATFYGL
jgi:predicted TIM-barrel fold metal-dependent hydrolase